MKKLLLAAILVVVVLGYIAEAAESDNPRKTISLLDSTSTLQTFRRLIRDRERARLARIRERERSRYRRLRDRLRATAVRLGISTP